MYIVTELIQVKSRIK